MNPVYVCTAEIHGFLKCGDNLNPRSFLTKWSNRGFLENLGLKWFDTKVGDKRLSPRRLPKK